MKLTSFIYINKLLQNRVLLILMFMIACKSNNVIADSLTYSPDQWPRHWNQLINKTRQEYLNNNRSNKNSYSSQRPERSPMWGMVPIVKQKPRRSLTPEYDTHSHMRNYYNQNSYRENYYAGNNFPGLGYGFPSSYSTPFNTPYIVPTLAPGLAAPGVPMLMHPYAHYPYMAAPPYMGGFPGMGSMFW